MDTDLDLACHAHELSAEEREAFLNHVTGGDSARRQVLEALILQVEAASAFFGEAEPERAAFPSARGENGTAIGPYILLEQIGEGGFGTVWMAEQRYPVRRKVALKIIKAGMDTREVVARFEQERQALAMMDHPNIAQVYDAGCTSGGRPYFAMELVKGVSITQYCDECRLPLKERLLLFKDICAAIHHAHQKGIIHRDIKPSNILVSRVEDRAILKVIDFGIAKATRGALSDGTLVTRLDQFMGTPAYMSPEQASGGAIDIDTRSDIYSLGVLLYELLTGTPPFNQKELLAAGYEAIRRVICEQDPPRPSIRVGTATEEDRTRLANTHQLQPDRFRRLIKGDLDWIVMRAMEKDRTRRYDSANALAADVRHFLADEPVSATPPSAVYGFRKFARRHRIAMGAGAAVAAALILGLGISTWMFFKERAALDLAAQRLVESEDARREAETTSEFVLKIFDSPSPAEGGPGVTVAEVLDKAAARLAAGDYLDRPEERSRMQQAIALSYAGLGMAEKAVPLLEEAGRYVSQTYSAEQRRSRDLRRLLALQLSYSHSHTKALQIMESCLTWELDHDPDSASSMKSRIDMAECLFNASRDSKYSGPNPLPEARNLLLEALPLSRQRFKTQPQETIRALGTLACVESRMGHYKEAVDTAEEGLKIMGEKDPMACRLMFVLTETFAGMNRMTDATRVAEKNLERCREIFKEGHGTVMLAASYLGQLYNQAGRKDDAISVWQASLLNVPGAAVDKARLGEALFEKKRYKEALEVLNVAARFSPNEALTSKIGKLLQATQEKIAGQK